MVGPPRNDNEPMTGPTPAPTEDPDDDPFAFAPDDRDRDSGDDPTSSAGVGHTSAGAHTASGAAAQAPFAAPLGLGERAEPAPPPGAQVSVVREMRSLPVSWIAGALFVLVGAILLASKLGADGDESRTALRAGDDLPAFAAPLASRPRLQFDAVNLATGDDQGPSGRIPACQVRSPSAVTSCGLLERGPLALILFRGREPSCFGAVDAVDAQRRRVPGVSVLALAIGGRHDDTAATARARGWTLPVAYDRDEWLTRRLGEPACEAVLLVAPDGAVLRRTDGRERGDAMRRLLASATRP